MKKWLKRIVLGVLALILLAIGTIWWLMRGSLPELDGELALAGLSAPVTVQRDANGTVTIDAANETDALRALGYVHAQERYFEMDLMRRMSAGELSELFGAIAVDTDKRQRAHRIRARVEANLDGILDGTRPQAQAYVDGVNAGLGALDVRPWPYLLLRQQPRPWTLPDSAVTGYAMYFDLQDASNHNELAMWKMQPHLPPVLFALLQTDGSRWDAPLMGGARGDAALPGADQVNLRNLPAPTGDHGAFAPDDIVPGSNNFAVASAATKDGRAIVADDMHLGLRAPGIWFRARLRYPDPRAPGGKVDITGFTLPGLPVVVVGSNTHVAWAFTNSYADTADWRIETTCPASGRIDGCVKPVVHRETIRVAGGAPITHEIEETAWGPVLHREGDRMFTLRWNGHVKGALGYGLSRFPLARDLDHALSLADAAAVPTQNLVVGDAKGRIGWRLIGPLAQRDASCTGAQPMTSDVACPPWSIATDRSPSVVDPANARLWTANNRTTDGDALATVGNGGYALGARARQIRDGLLTREKITERDLLAVQLDDRALFLAPWWTLLRDTAASAKTPSLAKLADASKRWEGRASVDSVSYRIVREWRLAVLARIADGLTAPARAKLGKDFDMPAFTQLEGVAWPMVTQRPMHLLSRRFESWDELFEDAAKEVFDDLEQIGPLHQRTWGERNTMAICHPLARAIPVLGKRMLCMPADQVPGDGSMPRVVGPAFGASERMVVSPGREAEGITHMPGGQSGHPLSPFWGAGHDDWVKGRPTPFLPGETRYTMTLKPGK
ncbi:MAG: penicillin acylase family protein [Xanthomonadaceae bacterium]|nr:penicillin acylase family protein [Xanthomonadaceae bacterium]